MPSSNCMSTSVLCKFQYSSLTIRPCRLDNDVLGVLYSNNYTYSELKLLPCLTKVDDVDSVVAALKDVTLHLEITVLGTKMDLGCQHHLDVSFFRR